MERFTVPLIEVKADDVANEMGAFSGYGSIFGNIDLGGDVVMAGAFEKSLREWQAKGEQPAMYGFHRMDNPIGDWLDVKEDVKGLYVRGQLWVKGESRIEQAIVAHNMMKGTGPKGLSIGYRVRDFENVEFNGGVVRQLKEIDLLEISVVGFPMNPKAMVESVKSVDIEKRSVEKILRDAGYSRREAKAFIAGGFDALKRDAESKGEVESRDDSLELSGVSESLQKLSTIFKG